MRRKKKEKEGRGENEKMGGREDELESGERGERM